MSLEDDGRLGRYEGVKFDLLGATLGNYAIAGERSEPVPYVDPEIEELPGAITYISLAGISFPRSNRR